MKPMKTTFSAIALFALAGPAFAADFASLDSNTDGQVDFAEYKASALAEGKTVTLAAQEFTRMAQGDAILTEDEFFLAEALADQPYALQPVLFTEPLTLDPVENVNSVETFESYPANVEAIEPPVVAEDVPEVTEESKNLTADPVIVEKPLDIDPVVAGEVETTDKLSTKSSETETPLEEGELDLSEDLDMEEKMDELEGG